jgi:predicted TIM-barrel fold metal-dependent hydrolase
MIPAMSIQDAHSHFFGRTFFSTLAKLSPREEDEATLLAEVHERAGVEIPEDDPIAHADRWLAEMDKAGVERMVTFASVPPEATDVSQAARHAAGRLVPYTVLDPTAEGALEFAGKALSELGFRGLLLFPAMHHFDLGSADMNPIYDLARAHSAPLVVHCGILQVKLRDLVGLPRPYDLSFANPLSVVPAANRFPDVSFVIPHFGGGFFREALMAGMQCENVMLDTSSSNSWMASDPGMLNLSRVFRSSLDALGPERILFGTDSCTFPRGYRTDVRGLQLEALHTAGATEAQIERIFESNMRELLP